MRTRLLNLAIFLCCAMLALLAGASSAPGYEKMGFANLTYETSKADDEGDITRRRTFSQNYTLRLKNDITSMLSYQLYLRAFLSDQSTEDPNNMTTHAYNRQLEPLVEFNLINPLYSVNLGYRRTEFWDTKSLTDDGRLTTDYYYGRLNLTPRDFPFFSFQADRQKRYNYLSPKTFDTTRTTYSGTSSFDTKYKDFLFSYSATYLRSEDKNPLQILNKLDSDNFSGSYNLGYSKRFLDGKLSVSSMYQGNYVWLKTKAFASVLGTGSSSIPRLRLSGLYRLFDSGPPPGPDENVGPLNTDFSLIDGNVIAAAASGIDLKATQHHNIGVQVQAGISVDRIFVYANANILSDTNLASAINWHVYSNNVNSDPAVIPWTLVPVFTVNRTLFDAVNNIYRYEIIFTTTHTAQFYKVVNLVASNALPAQVLVTEIEAYGPVTITNSTEQTLKLTTFTQGWNLNTTYKIHPKVTLTAGLFVNRTDLEPSSVPASIGGLFANSVSKSINGDADQINVTRSYTAGLNWQTSRLLTTEFRFTRNEAFDGPDIQTSDFKSNNYMLSFSSTPLPTVDATLTLTKNDNYSFDVKQLTTKSAVLSLGTKLYANINMVTDMGYLQAKSYISGIKASTWYVSGELNAILSSRFSGSMRYSFSWIDSDLGKSDQQEGSIQLTYRPGRFINISGSLKATNLDGLKSYESGFLIDWLPFSTIRLNLSYQYVWTDPRPDVTQVLSTYMLWRITKFMEAQVTYQYTRDEKERDRKGHSLTGNLNCRF